MFINHRLFNTYTELMKLLYITYVSSFSCKRDRSWSRRRLFCCIQISIVALLTSLVGTVLDSVGAVAYSKLKACANANNSDLSGMTTYFL